MNLLKSVIANIISEAVLLEGPLDKLRNMGIPEPFAEWFFDFLPEYSKNHVHWYALELKNSMHQFKDHIKQYKSALKRAKKEPALENDMKKIAEFQFDKWKESIESTKDDIETINKWAEQTNINLSKKKEVEITIGNTSRTESVPFSFAAAVSAANQYYNLQDGEVFMSLPNGWYWLDRESNYCSIEASLMGHCGRADDSNSTLFSLRDSNGLPHVTAEITFEDEGSTIKQMKGKGNSTPEKKYWPMIFALLKNEELDLKHYRASGRHGGDLRWEDIPEDVREEIEEIHEDFDDSPGRAIEEVLEMADEEISEAISNFEHDFYDVHIDSSSWDYTIDGDIAYVSAHLNWGVTLPEDIAEAFDVYKKELNHVVEKALSLSGIDRHTDWEFNQYGNNYSLGGHIDDDDLSTIVDVETTNVDNITDAIEYWSNHSPTKDEFLAILRRLLMLEGYLEGFQGWQVDELESELSNFDIAIEDDPEDDDFNIIQADMGIAFLANMSLEERKPIIDIAKSPGFSQEFFQQLMSHFSPSLQQMILPHVDSSPFNVPASATLGIYSYGIRLELTFDQEKNDPDEFVGFLKQMDTNAEKVSEIFSDMIKVKKEKQNTDHIEQK